MRLRPAELDMPQAIPIAGAGIAAPSIAGAAMTPDERIDAAISEITAAFREKWPDCPLRIDDYDNIDTGMIVIVSHVGADDPGSIRYRRTGTARI